MDVYTFTKVYKDKNFYHFNKMLHKYSQADFSAILQVLQDFYYTKLPLLDFYGNVSVYNPTYVPTPYCQMKAVFQNASVAMPTISQNIEEEIYHSLRIEQIATSRERVHKIYNGAIPINDEEKLIVGMEKGLAFIQDQRNSISEENLNTLYQLSIAPFLSAENALAKGAYYRNDTVYIVGNKVVHTGLPSQRLPSFMKKFIAFVKDTTLDIDVFHKAAMLHFYIAYLHPYFDGNGRMARLLHLWFLIQNGWESVIEIPLSKLIEESKEEYCRTFKQIEKNQEVSGILDITPFLLYFNQYVYGKIDGYKKMHSSMHSFLRLCKEGKMTRKEIELWQFVQMNYGKDEFSTKQLEKDYGHAAYATIRSFVLKGTRLGLFKHQAYGNRNRYAVR